VLAGAELDPVDGDDDADGVDDDDVVVAVCVDVVADVPEPPVAASATPVTPALRPPASTAVMISRRALVPVLETMLSSSPDEPRLARRTVSRLRGRPGSGPSTDSACLLSFDSPVPGGGC
jgi:hypothetical protein